MSKVGLGPEAYLEQPYTRVLIPDKESETFTAEIVEFPGCISQGDTAEEAYERLEETAKNWIEAALALGQEIPSPLAIGYSGRFALRLPKSLHRQASLAADKEGVSLNQFIVYAVSEKVGALNLYDSVAQRLIKTIEFHQDKFQTAVNEAFRQMEYAIEKRADTSPTQSGFEQEFITHVGGVH